MKLVPNLIYSRETEFSFWVRLVPVRNSSPSCWQWHRLRYPGTTGWPQEPQEPQNAPPSTLCPLLAHHCYYIWQRKGNLLLLFQSSYCHGEAENQHQSDDINSSRTNSLLVAWPKHWWCRRRFQLTVGTQTTKHPQPRASGCQMFQNHALKKAMTLNIPPCTVCREWNTLHRPARQICDSPGVMCSITNTCWSQTAAVLHQPHCRVNCRAAGLWHLQTKRH